MNSLPYPMSMGEIKDSVARVARLSQTNIGGDLVEDAVYALVNEGKIVVRDEFGWKTYVSRRHIPRFRTLDADWQW